MSCNESPEMSPSKIGYCWVNHARYDVCCVVRIEASERAFADEVEKLNASYKDLAQTTRLSRSSVRRNRPIPKYQISLSDYVL